jgi:thymidylate kinase
MERVVTAYDKLAAEEPDRFEVIDATLDIDEVTSLAHAAVRGR